ncbi:hypothetical protein [Natrinema halophilum]|uniref:hypothetical protein n=1 Tax=Natrinema halophilum TaxID=1699371 RepID=UPI001F207C91|nr:hypothetical protein [Natrinema halophilum]UHQ96416.1 hypothetical protein HYG82_23535 [Natrinema halophilum]
MTEQAGEDGPIVFLAVTTSGGYGNVYHSDSGCRAIANARSVSEKPLSLLDDDDYRECQVCQGTASDGGCPSPNATRKLLESLNPEDVGLSPLGEVDSDV